MLDNKTLRIGDVTNKVSFNTPCTGMMQKSHPKSNFIRFHFKSKLAEWVFSEYPRIKGDESGYIGGQLFYTKKIVVLQVMVFGDNEMLVEYVYEKDLESNE